MARLFLLASLVAHLAACGSGNAGGAPGPTHPAAPPTAGPTSPTPTVGTAQTDLTALVQAVLDLPALAPYWHAELADRHPLVLAESEATQGLSLRMFGEPVQLVALDQVGARAYFRVTGVELAADHARVSFEYAAEGLAGEAQFARRPQGWQLVHQDIAER